MSLSNKLSQNIAKTDSAVASAMEKASEAKKMSDAMQAIKIAKAGSKGSSWDAIISILGYSYGGMAGGAGALGIKKLFTE